MIDGTFGAYSDIVALQDGRIGVIYEAKNYTRIRFVLFKYDLIPLE